MPAIQAGEGRRLQARPRERAPRQRREEGVKGPDDRGPEPAADVQRHVRRQQVPVRPGGAGREHRAGRDPERQAERGGEVPADRPWGSLQRAPLHRQQRPSVAGEPDEERGDGEVDERVGADGDRDREQDGPGVPGDELGADPAAARRVGRQERSGEELARAEDELRDAADEDQVERQPATPGPRIDRIDHCGRDAGDEHRDRCQEEGADHVAGPQRPRRLRAGLAAAPAGTGGPRAGGGRVARCHRDRHRGPVYIQDMCKTGPTPGPAATAG